MLLYLSFLVLFSAFRTNRELYQHPIPVKYLSPEKLEERARNGKDVSPIGEITKSEKSGTFAWVFFGPQPILNEYWSGDTFASGRVSDILIDPHNPNIVYIAGAQGGVWKSEDGGTIWKPITDKLPSLASGALAMNPLNTNVIYYGTGEQHFSADSYYGDGLFKSLDAGTTWRKIANTSDVGNYISRIIVSPDDTNIVHLGSDMGYIRSIDGGNTWKSFLSTNWCTDLCIRSDSSSIIFAAIYQNGIYRSTDAGSTWTKLTNGLPTSGFYRINMAISNNAPRIIYASFVNSSGGLLGMYKTTDGGDNWVQLSNTPNYLGWQGWYDNCIVVDPLDSNRVYAGGVFPYASGYYGIIMTTDGGNNWTDITVASDGSQLHPDMHTLAIGGGYLWVGNDGGMWKTNSPGTTWINLNATLGIAQFYTLDFHPTDTTFIIGGTQDNGSVSYTGNYGWPQIMEGDGGPVAVDRFYPQYYYTTYVYMTYLTKWDNGVYVGDVTGPWTSDRASWCSGPLVADINTGNTLYAGTYRVWKTTNGGTSWDSISTDLTNGGVLRAITTAKGNSNIIYTGSSDGKIYFTDDGGANWYDRSPSGITNAIPNIILDPNDGGIGYICIEKRGGLNIFSTLDSGKTWQDITGDFPVNVKPLSMAVDFNLSPIYIFVGTDYGVYASSDTGTTWIKQDSLLPNAAVFAMKFDDGNDYLIAATHGRGMWRSKIYFNGVVSKRDKRINTSKFLTVPSISNNINVEFFTKTREYIDISIFDITGRKIQQIVKGNFTGIHSVKVDKNEIPSGIYFVYGKFNNTFIVKRIVIINP